MAPNERVDSVYNIDSEEPDDHGERGDVSSAPVPWRRDEDEDGGEYRGGGEFTVHPVTLLRRRRETDRRSCRDAIGLMVGVGERTMLDEGQSMFGRPSGAKTVHNGPLWALVRPPTYQPIGARIISSSGSVRTLPLYSYHVRLDIRQALWGTIVSYNTGLRASLVFHVPSSVILNAEFGLLDLICLFDGGCDWSDNHLNSTEVHSSVLDCIGKRAR